MDKWTKLNTLALLMIIGLLAFKATTAPATGHKCKWDLCPYKGIQEAQYRTAVTNYVGEKLTDAWCIDMLHLEFPDAEYEELENRLFNPKKYQ